MANWPGSHSKSGKLPRSGAKTHKCSCGETFKNRPTADLHAANANIRLEIGETKHVISVRKLH